VQERPGTFGRLKMRHSLLNKLSRKRKLVAGSIFVAVLLSHSSAFGHARLVQSQPEANSTQNKSSG